MLQVPARVVEGKAGLALSVFGQTINLAKGGPHAIGSTVWLSILRVLSRPESDDSMGDG